MFVFRLLVFIFSLVIGGCQKELSQKQYVHISFHTGIRSLDPGIAVDYPSAFVTKMLFEGLLHNGPEGNILPGIAKNYELSADHKTYIFHLRSSYWSNGDKVTAYDFEYSWKKTIAPGGSLGVNNFYSIKNARAASLGKISPDEIGIHALDENTLQIELECPTAYFLQAVASPSFLPVNSHVDQSSPGWANKTGKEFVCNGPFMLEKHRINNEILVVKNPNYWNAQKVSMPGIHISIIEEISTQMNLYEKKQLSWLGRPLSKIPMDAVEYLKSRDDVNFYKTLGVYWYFVNTEAFPFNNKKMRKAFAYAINREEITKHITQCGEKPALGVLPYTLATQENPFFEDHDQTRALQLFNEALEELGITKEELPEITINFGSADIHQRVAEALQEHWDKTFGLNLKLENQEWKVHFSKLQKGNYQLGGMGWQSWLRDPIHILQTFVDKDNGINMSRWENKTYQALIEATEKEIDPIKRRALFNEAETLLIEEMPVIPIYFMTIAYAKDDHLKNVYLSDLYEVDFRWSYFEDD